MPFTYYTALFFSPVLCLHTALLSALPLLALPALRMWLRRTGCGCLPVVGVWRARAWDILLCVTWQQQWTDGLDVRWWWRMKMPWHGSAAAMTMRAVMACGWWQTVNVAFVWRLRLWRSSSWVACAACDFYYLLLVICFGLRYLRWLALRIARESWWWKWRKMMKNDDEKAKDEWELRAQCFRRFAAAAALCHALHA